MNGPQFFIALVLLGFVASAIDMANSEGLFGLSFGGGAMFWAGLAGMLLYWENLTPMWWGIGALIIIYLIINSIVLMLRRPTFSIS